MSTAFTVKETSGTPATYIGQIVCRSQHRVVLLLTHPYNSAGRIVEIPVDSIIDEHTYEPVPS